MAFRIGRDVLNDCGLLVIRLMLGSVFIFHGAQKLFGVWDGPGLSQFATYLETLSIPYPAYAAVLAGGAELLGGAALVTGIWMRSATLPLIGTMAVAIALVHQPTMSAQADGFEYPLTLAVVLCGLTFTGPGRFWLNLDAVPRLSTSRAKTSKAKSGRVELGGYAPLDAAAEPIRRTVPGAAAHS